MIALKIKTVTKIHLTIFVYTFTLIANTPTKNNYFITSAPIYEHMPMIPYISTRDKQEKKEKKEKLKITEYSSPVKKLSRNLSRLSRNNLLQEVFITLSNSKPSIGVKDMRDYLKSKGFLGDDTRWEDVYGCLNSIEEITINNFVDIFSNNISDLTRSINDNFVIDDFGSFTGILAEIFENRQILRTRSSRQTRRWQLVAGGFDGER